MNLNQKIGMAVMALASATFVSHAHAAPAPSEGQIAEVLMTANEAEIDAAKTAKKNATNGQVKEFADHMIAEHTANKDDGKKLTKDLKIKTKSTPLADGVKKDAKAKMADLKKISKGEEYDRTYIEQQVAMHTNLMNDLDSTFIPAATTPQFKEFLQTTRGHVEQHLAKAKELQATLSK